LNGYIFSALIICALIIIFRYDFYGSGGERITIQVFGNPAIDPNYLGAYLVVPFTLCYGRLLKKFKWVNCVGVLVLAAGIFSTASRGAMLSAFVGAFFTSFLFFLKKRKKEKNVKKRKITAKKILIIVAVILVCCIVVSKYVPINSLIRLFNFSGYDDASNSKRFANWFAGLEAFSQRPMFGYGPCGEMGIIQAVTGMSKISHSTYIAALIQFGLIGVLLFGVYVFYLLRKNKSNCTVVGSIIATLVVCIFISAQVAVFLWIPLIMASIVGNYKDKESLSIM
jgi:O-antigen ligase